MLKRILLALDSSDFGPVAVSFTMALASQATAVRVLHINEFLVGGRGLTLETSAASGVLLDDALLHSGSWGLMACGVVAWGPCSWGAGWSRAEARRWSVAGVVRWAARRRG